MQWLILGWILYQTKKKKVAAKDHKQNLNMKSGSGESFVSIKFPGWITILWLYKIMFLFLEIYIDILKNKGALCM